MDRMGFIPGPQAKEQIFNAQGHMFFSRQTALDFADEFIMNAPGGAGSPHLSILYQTMLACISDGEQVDIWFGLKNPDPAAGHEEFPSGELVGHSWALVRTTDGKERPLWEVGRKTPIAGDAFAARAYNAYCEAMARFLGREPPSPVAVDPSAAEVPREFNGKPVISRALSPSNLYYASGRMWYFVDLSPPGDLSEPAILSRPMRSFDALALSALMTLALGTPPLVFGSIRTMTKIPQNEGEFVPVTAKGTTALLLIDCQLGFRNVAAWGSGTSTPDFERNVTAILAKFRTIFESKPDGERPLIIHVQHKSVWTDSPMHPGHVGPYGVHGEEKRGIDFLEFAAPRLFRNGKHEFVVFINTPLEMLLNKRGIKTLLIAGMTTDVAVSTAVRMAHNLALVGKWGGKGNMEDAAESELQTDGISMFVKTPEDAKEGERGEDGYLVSMPRIVLIADATRTFGKAGVDAQTVQNVHVEGLKEFCEVRNTSEILGTLE
ncbi:hypothetical protein O9K51_04983 [Purpureocillium lavendulum]|uniref:Isochorismatase-like domain-containing protein n=1 Tax=Purpureocillium lavendulum TaxID=1247861 RepID=A0AB34FPJ6_9HYPO|nr:hypothetical protein O9K51_04983 [Purpureocillium lavendulum]